MESNPKISVVIASLNAVDTIGRCLESIRVQTFSCWEVLVCDGGSSDGTKMELERYDDVIEWWSSRSDGGVYHAWNHALPRCRGEYVCFLGADDYLASALVFEEIVNAIGDREYDLVSSFGCLVGIDGERKFVFGGAWDYSVVGRKMPLCHPGLLHRRQLFAEFGLFDSSYQIAADLEFLLRLPSTTTSLHVSSNTVFVQDGGMSRHYVLHRLKEQRMVLARCPRYGLVKAYLVWFEKLLKLPLARLFNIAH